MYTFKWILLVALLGLWGVETVWAEDKKEEAAEEEDAPLPARFSTPTSASARILCATPTWSSPNWSIL